ncbi:MAG: P-loop NTPase [Nanoarchaeota archaeon]|nr:P-loop NTPase [Nanoarchaeota archaeon]MBU1644239.1 P-loop NTPase [Nanoarchaeota archaeon]MBU1977241.1 P-loop NTPase [Nanoarchaeota archaeon]
MTKFVALVSGKGGVGKTTATLNVGQALVNLGKDVVLVDANIVTPNLAIQLGFMNPEGTLNKFLRKEKEIKEITYLHESGISLIPSSPSYEEFQKTNPQKIFKLFEHLDEKLDFVLIDSPSGLGYDIHQILKNTDEVLVVVTPTMTSVVDALKTIQLAKANNNTIAGIILNMTHGGRNELTSAEVENILGHPILANIKNCRKVRKAAHRQLPLNYIYPRSRTAKEFNKIARHLTMDYKN